MKFRRGTPSRRTRVYIEESSIFALHEYSQSLLTRDLHQDSRGKPLSVLDTDKREIEPVRNPITIFKKFVYDDETVDYNNIDIK